MADSYTQWERDQRRIEREIEQQQRAEKRAQDAAARERQKQYVEKRKVTAKKKTAQLVRAVEELESILRTGLQQPGRLDVISLYREPQLPELKLGDLASPIPEPEFVGPDPPGRLSRLLGGGRRYDQYLQDVWEDYENDLAAARRAEDKRQHKVAAKRQEHEATVQRIREEYQQYNEALAALENGVSVRDKASVERYLEYVLHAVPLPGKFPRHAEIIFNPTAEQVVVRFELPPREVVPTVRVYQYVEKADEERATDRPAKEVAALYRSIVSQVALLCLRNLFQSDDKLDMIGFNGHVHAVNPATGVREFPCMVSVQVERESFLPDENLAAVTAEVCLQKLGAIISRHPYEHEPIEPILDFDLSKFSFVEGLDAVATLDSRPNLLDMSPGYFEHLVRQIFVAQGAEGWTTTQSSDDGIDAVIAKRTALMGGLSIVQAKRYNPNRDALGPSHVRELAGAMEEKKAGWGILITTSRFTAGCHQKAREHGRMELIDGNRLVWLIKEHLGKDVLIGPPPKKQG
jgi:restriction system protein